MRNNLKFLLYVLIFVVNIMAFWRIILVGASIKNPRPIYQLNNKQVSDFSDPIYLPLISQACIPDIVESPFSIQIAALHQITTSAANTMAPRMSEAQFNAWYDQAFSSLVTYLRDSGAGYTRVYIRWSDIQPNAPVAGQPPVYDSYFLQWYDDRLRQIAQAGIKMIVTMGYVPEWAGNEPSCPPISLDHRADYQQFLTDLVTRYSQPPYNIKHWEIFNEADSTYPLLEWYGCWGNYGTDYTQILSISQPVIKTIVPDATVLMSGLAYDWFTPAGPFNRRFPDNVMAAGGANYFDALNFHYFTDFAPEWERWTPGFPPTCGNVEDGEGTPYDAYGIDIIAKTKHFTNRMSTCFGVNKPVWLTELGAHGYPDDPASLDSQARYVIQGNIRGLAAGIQNITWYALATPNDPFEQGLLYNSDLTPKPAYYSYQTMTRELKNFKYDRSLYLPEGEAYVFRNTCGSEKTVAWGNNVPLTFSPASSLRVVNYLGNVSTITDGGAGDMDGSHNGSVQILITAPVFISVTSN